MPPLNVPMVSVIMPMLNEERFVESCLLSVLETHHPLDRLEVIVVDGMSSDRSRDIVLEFAERHPQVRLVDNPRRIIPAALNIGIAASTGEVIVRMDVHCLYDPGYISACVELLESTGASSVGGCQRAEGTDWFSSAIATVVSSRLAAGDAKYRLGASETTEVDTVFLGAWRRETIESLGGFREDWQVNEDYEFNIRLRKSGGKIVLSDRIKSRYFSRSSLRALARQYARYGFWKGKTVVEHPESLRWRQLVAPSFVIASVASLAVLKWTELPAIVLGGAYGLAVATASIAAARRCGWSKLPILPMIYGIVHIGWGTGFLVGFMKFRLNRSAA